MSLTDQLLRVRCHDSPPQLTGIIQLARSPYFETCIAPSIVKLMWPLGGGEKLEDDIKHSKKSVENRNVTIIALRSAGFPITICMIYMYDDVAGRASQHDLFTSMVLFSHVSCKVTSLKWGYHHDNVWGYKINQENHKAPKKIPGLYQRM